MSEEIKQEEKKQTQGKTLGAISFFVSEIIVILGALYQIFALFKTGSIDASMFSNVLLFQGSVFITVWGAKATSNFAKKDGKQ